MLEIGQPARCPGTVREVPRRRIRGQQESMSWTLPSLTGATTHSSASLLKHRVSQPPIDRSRASQKRREQIAQRWFQGQCLPTVQDESKQTRLPTRRWRGSATYISSYSPGEWNMIATNHFSPPSRTQLWPPRRRSLEECSMMLRIRLQFLGGVAFARKGAEESASGKG